MAAVFTQRRIPVDPVRQRVPGKADPGMAWNGNAVFGGAPLFLAFRKNCAQHLTRGADQHAFFVGIALQRRAH